MEWNWSESFKQHEGVWNDSLFSSYKIRGDVDQESVNVPSRKPRRKKRKISVTIEEAAFTDDQAHQRTLALLSKKQEKIEEQVSKAACNYALECLACSGLVSEEVVDGLKSAHLVHLMELTEIDLVPPVVKGVCYCVFHFEVAWDPEHGMSVLLYGDSVLDVEEMGDSFQERSINDHYLSRERFEAGRVPQHRPLNRDSLWRCALIDTHKGPAGIPYSARASKDQRFLEFVGLSDNLSYNAVILERQSGEKICSGSKAKALKLNRLGKKLLGETKEPSNLEFLDHARGLPPKGLGDFAQVRSNQGYFLDRKRKKDWVLRKPCGTEIRTVPYKSCLGSTPNLSFNYCGTQLAGWGDDRVWLLDIPTDSVTNIAEGLPFTGCAFSKSGGHLAAIASNVVNQNCWLFLKNLETGEEKRWSMDSSAMVVLAFAREDEEFFLLIGHSSMKLLELSSLRLYGHKTDANVSRSALSLDEEIWFGDHNQNLYQLSSSDLVDIIKGLANPDRMLALRLANRLSNTTYEEALRWFKSGEGVNYSEFGAEVMLVAQAEDCWSEGKGEEGLELLNSRKLQDSKNFAISQYAHLLRSVFLSDSQPLLAFQHLCQVHWEECKPYREALLKRALHHSWLENDWPSPELPIDKDQIARKILETTSATQKGASPLTLCFELQLEDSFFYLELECEKETPRLESLIHFPRDAADYLLSARSAVTFDLPHSVPTALAKCGFCLHKAALSRSALAVLRLALKLESENHIAKPSVEALEAKGFTEWEELGAYLEVALHSPKSSIRFNKSELQGSWWMSTLAERLDAHMATWTLEQLQTVDKTKARHTHL